MPIPFLSYSVNIAS